MPAKSKAQFKKMFVLAKHGDITKSQLGDFTHNVNYQHLPVHAPKKKKLGNPPDDDEDTETTPDDETAEMMPKKKK